MIYSIQDYIIHHCLCKCPELSRAAVGEVFPVRARHLIHELLVITQLHFLYCTKINVIKVE